MGLFAVYIGLSLIGTHPTLFDNEDIRIDNHLIPQILVILTEGVVMSNEREVWTKVF